MPDLPVSSPSHILFSGIVHVFNEAEHLARCLESLAFCDQLIVIDFGSTDGSTDVAHTAGAEVHGHDLVAIPDAIRGWSASFARHNWLIFLDPDEVFPCEAEAAVTNLIVADPALGSAALPWQFYFRGRALLTTVWGRERVKRVVVHKDRVQLASPLFAGIQTKEPYTAATLPHKPEYTIAHYWANSYRELSAKHRRYIPLEGERRWQKGERFTWGGWALKTTQSLKRSLFDCHGLSGGVDGILLSLFHAWYTAAGLLSLRCYQRSRERQAHG